MLKTMAQFYLDASTIAISDRIPFVAIDFETTGLRPYAGDTAFILGYCFEIDGKLETHSVYTPKEIKESLELLLSNKNIKYLAHSATFEMSFLEVQFGIEIKGSVWDTEVFARLCHNNYQSYSLQNCSVRAGRSKIQEAMDFTKKNKHDYTKLPEDLLVRYVEQDAYLSALLYKEQHAILSDWQRNSDIKPGFLVSLEMKTTKNLHKMHSNGICIDVDYCQKALEYETKRQDDAKAEFEKLTGVTFVDSRKTLAPIFKSHGLKFSTTAKGNDSFGVDTLDLNKDNAIVKSILQYRDASKRVSTYWMNYLELHTNGVIHANIRQAGTATGRFSSWEPNLQNITDDTDSLYPIRRAFIASPDSVLVSIDYAAMELRHIADEADEFELIGHIKNGIDFHQVVATQAGVPRNLAKAVRFARLYGAGIPKIASMLKAPEAHVRAVVDAIDQSAPRIKEYSYQLIRDVKTRGYGYNAYGRRYFFDKTFEYKAPNFRCQGSCSDILRIAIDNTTKYLADKKSYLCIPVHDECIFNVHNSELQIIPELRRLMIAAHTQKKSLDMDCAIAVGPNLHDMRSYNG